MFPVATHILLRFIAFDRTNTYYVVFRFRGFDDAPRVLLADVSSLQALAAIFDHVKHLALMLLYCQFGNCEEMTKSVVGGGPKHTQIPDKATKHIERTFIISDYY